MWNKINCIGLQYTFLYNNNNNNKWNKNIRNLKFIKQRAIFSMVWFGKIEYFVNFCLFNL